MRRAVVSFEFSLGFPLRQGQVTGGNGSPIGSAFPLPDWTTNVTAIRVPTHDMQRSSIDLRRRGLPPRSHPLASVGLIWDTRSGLPSDDSAMRGVVFFSKFSTGLLVIALSAVLVSCSSLEGEVDATVSLTDDPLPGKFIWHDLITDDVDSARTFYASVLGWTFENATRPDDGGPYTLARAGDRYVAGLVQKADAADGANLSRWLGYLSVGDVDRAADIAAREGGEVARGDPAGLSVPAVRVAAIARIPRVRWWALRESRVGDPADGALPAAGQVVWNELLTSDLDGVRGVSTPHCPGSTAKDPRPSPG